MEHLEARREVHASGTDAELPAAVEPAAAAEHPVVVEGNLDETEYLELPTYTV